MRIDIIILLWFTVSLNMYAQGNTDHLPGAYSGFYNHDALSLVIEAPSGGSYRGVMHDSYQTYLIELTRSGASVRGTATESSVGLVFQVQGSCAVEQLQLNFSIEIQGTPVSMDIAFTRQGAQSVAGDVNAAEENSMTFPVGAVHPASLVGTWTKEELYQSGYGDNYMGGGVSQSMTLLPDGRMAEAGSNAYISGSNYSGQASGGGGNVIPNTWWYTVSNQLYLIISENGNAQTHHLGKFYVEDGNMLITGTNGEKVLLQKR